MKTIIKAENLTKRFGDLTAVDGISFEIYEGECFGFLGPNGAGKTTTVRMIHCVSPITSGSILVNGLKADVDNRKIKAMTGVIPQEITLDNDLTVFENMMVFTKFFDIPRREARRRTDELIAFVELEAKRNNKISELSTGMKRRLLVARALLNKPALIIADEPTTGLDPQARHLIWQRLRLLKNQGSTLILTTQYMEEAQQLCDRLVVMYEGKILKEGSPRRLIDDEIGREVVEIRIDAAEDARLISALGPVSCGHERAGDTLFFYCRDGREIQKKLVELDLPNTVHRPATLEDVFLKLTGRSLIE
ncbi:MAG TPA: ATP-binding cassette domain-containing protein [Candidatus Aminicenantes bacterium]|nr:ATP-binding cassette domain-containing protein [Candidatus Aminicenantes bacterium]HQF98011.1 ATP-binding cassette domain-containing protein [Candidatus Aminicenantes bacterium]HQH45722.1 ATP-binding cassette domain-containing protein [Candidatus Aminicenantes bacterium]HQJ43023.1 ATP-binding cassette domain-containing protein [Candidatus Aminicenantes bacterium]